MSSFYTKYWMPVTFPALPAALGGYRNVLFQQRQKWWQKHAKTMGKPRKQADVRMRSPLWITAGGPCTAPLTPPGPPALTVTSSVQWEHLRWRPCAPACPCASCSRNTPCPPYRVGATRQTPVCWLKLLQILWLMTKFPWGLAPLSCGKPTVNADL